MSLAWTVHDVFDSEDEAVYYGESIIELGLARGVRVSPIEDTGEGVKFELSIRPLRLKSEV